MTARPRILSGMQPSGRLHLGNYVGALANWVRLQETHACFYMVADWHAVSTNYAETDRIKLYTREMLIDWLAAGLDPARSTIFIQSKVPEHAVLHLLLSMIVPVPWLERNPTYKEQQEQLANRDMTTYGFLGYPVLQSADILLYRADEVPVGQDQLPHLELTREIARRFNHVYRGVFPEPKALLTEAPKLPGTDGRKMSKSYNNAIFLSDPEPTVREKLRTMVTDPARKRRSDPGNPEVCPVFDLHKIFSPTSTIERINVECRTAAIGCLDCKALVADAIVDRFKPIWEKRAALAADPASIDRVVREGTEHAQSVARETLASVNDAMHL
ncbi:MAG: tryptophan--tRNA ligase [Nitrospirae bacterium]|nr:tryptophan--tRNA ligase [Nitrospirota bacterium]